MLRLEGGLEDGPDLGNGARVQVMVLGGIMVAMVLLNWQLAIATLILLPLMLFIVPDPLLWLPVIGAHLLFFSSMTLRTRLDNIEVRKDL